jgi:GAF domain-containing protein
MVFAAGLARALRDRESLIESEFDRGDSLEKILDRHLLAVERMAERELITSILLLSCDGKRLYHGAGPNLPRSYRAAIDGAEIGPSAGSCGTAAYLGRPIYVSDIASDPLWADYRHVALPHGLRSCWSTPIRDTDGCVIATFAIYHRTPVSPSEDELVAIEMISGHVAQAILRARDGEKTQQPATRAAPTLTLVADNRRRPDAATEPIDGLLAKAARLEAIAQQLQEQLDKSASRQLRADANAVVEQTEKLARLIRQHVERLRRFP